MDAQAMKDRIKAQAMKPQYDVANFYYTTGPWQHIARTDWFGNMTLVVIAFNALWISIDTDNNGADVLLDAQPLFQVVEHLFCLYFSFEWIVRFLSFKRKRDGLKDAWFVFDSSLVFMMVGETWIMTIVLINAGGEGGNPMGNASVLRMARLMRLSRMARMARLFRAMPELLILIKAMAASIRSCFFVFMLLTLLLYVYGIMFRQLAAGSEIGRLKFSSVTEAMHTLWLDGTLLDNTGSLVEQLIAESYVLVSIFYSFVMLSALTVMNMLIGVLCEVVSAVAATEKEQLTVSFVKTRLQDILQTSGLDANGDGEISKSEFAALLEFPEACKALSSVGVDVAVLVDNVDFIFEAPEEGDDDDASDAEKVLSFEEFMELVLDMRGGNTATVKDMVELQKFTKRQVRELRTEMRKWAVDSCGMKPTESMRPSGYVPNGMKTSRCGSLKEELTSNDVADYDDFDLRARVAKLGNVVEDLRKAANAKLEVSGRWEALPGRLDLESESERFNLEAPSSPPPSPPITSPLLSVKGEVKELLRESIMPELQRLCTDVRRALPKRSENASEVAVAKTAERKIHAVPREHTSGITPDGQVDAVDVWSSESPEWSPIDGANPNRHSKRAWHGNSSSMQ